MKKKISLGMSVALLLLTAITTFNITFLSVQEGFNKRIRNFGALESQYNQFSEIRQYIDKYFVGEYETTEAMDGAIAGYIAGMGDQWSHYLNKEEYQQYQLESVGVSTGIGVSATYDGDVGAILVLDVYSGSPAQKAGVLPFDYITHVAGESVAEMGYTVATGKIRGEKGTSVTITVVSNGVAKDVTIVRDKVQTQPIRSEMLDGNVGYIRVTEFSQNSEKSFLSQLDALVQKGATSLVFDVRFNPGGALTALTPMLDALMPSGDIITLKDKAGQGEPIVSDATALDLPMAVLVNDQSYSAAEFFAAALQETEKAVIVGVKTSGKGYSQQAIPLKDGGALLLSTHSYFTPKGNNLAGIGVTPDAEVVLSPEKTKNFLLLPKAEDDQLQKAISLVKK